MFASEPPEDRRGHDRRQEIERRQQQVPVDFDSREAQRRSELARRAEDQLRIDMCETVVSPTTLTDDGPACQEV